MKTRLESPSKGKLSDASIFRIFVDLFPGRERRYVLGVLGMSILGALFETLGVASILPFLALVLNPSAIERYPIFQDMMRVLSIDTTQGAILFAGLATATVIAVGNAVAATNVFVQYRFISRTEIRLTTSLFSGYLNQPYSFHVQRDAPSIMKVLSADVNAVVFGLMTPMALALSKLVMALSIVVFLFIRDPLGATAVALIMIVSYWATYKVVRTQQHRQGIIWNAANEVRARLAQETLGGIKELQVLGRVRTPVDEHTEAVSVASRALATSSMAAQLPRYVLETVAFGGILVATLILVAGSSASTATVVPVLALYAFAGYRLMPALQIVFGAAVNLRFYVAPLRALHVDFMNVAKDAQESTNTADSLTDSTDVRLEKEFRLDDVSFTYPGASKPVLKHVSLVIRPSETIGLVGRTGAGKSTLADVILGLYEADSGEITVDGRQLRGQSIRSWQQRVGYVPQSVYLSNASVRTNIAFGTAPEDVDDRAVRHAARLAQAQEFILSLPQGYDTVVGERGVRLSGGQRQRLGIARALYHRPDVLVFDEATSALDGLTEDSVMEAIQSLAGERTIVFIAHRLRTVRACDRIVMLEEGSIIADGSYDELMKTSVEFRRLVTGVQSEQLANRSETVA